MVGIISAMPEEIDALLQNMEISHSMSKGKRTYHQGQLFGREIVLVFSRWGKVAAATTVTQMILHYPVEEIIFTGVAGAIGVQVNIGDVVVGDRLYQHDLDGSPIVEKFVVPILGKKWFETNQHNRKKLLSATNRFMETIDQEFTEKEKEEFFLKNNRVHQGNIASGDRFISTIQEVQNIRKELPGVLCVEMEGAAVAQVCFEYNLPFSIIRTISDKADNNAHIDFPAFAKQIASRYALGILKGYLAINQ